MNISLPYGTRQVSFNVPDGVFTRMYDPVACAPAADFDAEIVQAIDNPVGSPDFDDIVRNAKKINIIADDMTRPTPVNRILPILAGRLAKVGVKDEQIKIIIALGSHRYMTEDELRERVGDAIYKRYKVENSEFRAETGLVFAGKTPEDADIFISKNALDADCKIGIGNFAPHPVMGWSGGGKIIYPGVAGEGTVAYFHLKASLYDENLFGKDTTPVREMMEGWVDAVGLNFIINTVLTPDFKLHRAVAGHYKAAYKAGVDIAKSVLGCKVDEKADVAVVSSHPADQDFWQSPKGMYGAEPALKGETGGTIILVSPNYEGVGNHPEFLEWMGRDDGDAYIKGIFAGQPYTGDPLAIAVGNSMSKMRRRRRLVVVSDGVSAREMDRCGCIRYPMCDLQKCIDAEIKRYADCRLAAVTNGAETVLYN